MGLNNRKNSWQTSTTSSNLIKDTKRVNKMLNSKVYQLQFRTGVLKLCNSLDHILLEGMGQDPQPAEGEME